MDTKPRPELPRQQIAEFCKRNHILKLSLFGSFLTGTPTAESDVDFLVEFSPGREPGLLRLAAMEAELSDIIGRKADLRTAAELSKHFRQEVVESSELQYAQG